MPEDVVGVMGLLVDPFPLMGIEDGTAEGHVLGAVAITAQGHVPAGEDKFKLVGAGFAEDGDGLPFPEAADVILQLLVPALVPVRIGHPKEDFAEQGLLVGRVEFAVNRGVGNFPVVLEAGTQKPTFLVHVIPGEANDLPLLFIQ